MTINYDFSGVADTNPYTLADFDHITALGGSDFQISSGSLRTTYTGSTTYDAIARYNGTAATTGTVSMDFTMLYDSTSASGPIAVGLLDASGNGYMMLVNYNFLTVQQCTAGVASGDAIAGMHIGSAPVSVTFGAGATLGVDFDLDNGTATVYINGTQSGTQATGLTFTGMAAAVLIAPGDSGTNGIVTLDVTGESGAASNTAPVINDQTFSVADSASNGTVIGTLVATDSDGTVDNYAISGSTLAINSTTGQITLNDNSGIVAGTPITATATVTDDDGDTDTATVTVNVTNSGLSFSCYDADSSNAAITSETLSHVRVLSPTDLSDIASFTSVAVSSSGSAEIDSDSLGDIGDTVLVAARRSNGDVTELFSIDVSDLAAS